MTSLPIISLEKYADAQSLAQPLYDACTQSGFFYVTDHGISEELTSSMFSVMRQFFAQSTPDKVQCPFDTKSGLGYTGLGAETLDPSKNVTGDAKESFYLDRLGDSNATLPTAIKSHKVVISDFHSKCEQISLRLLAGMAAALRLPLQTFTSSHSGRENRLRLIHYPPFPASNTESIDMRASQHTDYGSVTLLTTEGVGGLQVRQADGRWSDVQHLPGAIIVNIADALEFWTGGKLKSTLHRVVLPRSNAESKSRYSIAFFVQPDFDTALQVFTDSMDCSDEVFDARLAEKGIQAGTRRITSGEFLKARLARTYA